MKSEFQQFLKDTPELSFLSDAQRRSLDERLRYIVEMCEKIHLLNESEKLFDDIDDIELDAWINVGAPTDDSRGEVSSWMIHATWTKEIEVPELQNMLPTSIVGRLDEVFRGSTELEVSEWIGVQAEAVQVITESILKGREFAPCVAHLIALDLLILNLLSAMTRIRLQRWKDI